MKPTISRLQDLLEYNPATGLFRWHQPSPHQAKSWFRGNKSVRQYRRLWIDKHHYMAHVIAWTLQTGVWPDNEIDHRDGEQSNNQWVNLRAAERSQNCMNCKKNKNNTTGFRGVTRFNTSTKLRFRATLRARGNIVSLGVYDNIEEAIKARKAGEAKWYGEWAHPL